MADLGMTKVQAENLSRALSNGRVRLVGSIQRTQRMRSIRESVRAITIAEYRRDLEAFTEFQEALQKAYGIGGY